MLTADKAVNLLELLHGDSTEASTSIQLATELVNQLNLDWSNPKLKILDPVCGRGMILLAVFKKLKDAGHSPAHIIKNMIYGVDVNKIQYLTARRALFDISGVEPNIYCEDSLTKEWSMRFDTVVGNPPYQNGENSKFYKEFITKSKSLSDVVAFVVPSSNFKDLSEFNNLRHYHYSGLAFKGVQLLTSWFIWDKNYNGPCNVIANDGSVLVNKFHVAPTQDVADIKTISSILNRNLPGLDYGGGKLLRQDGIIDPNGIWCVWSCGYRGEDLDKVKVSPSQANMLGGAGKHKVIFSHIYTTTAIGPLKYAPPDHACAAAARYIEVANPTEADNLIGYLESKFVRYIVAAVKGTTVGNSKLLFRSIPSIDVTRSWTDTDIYTHFGLTQAEITQIEASVK